MSEQLPDADLETEDLVLRGLRDGDTPFLRALLTDEPARRYLGGPVAPEALDERIARYRSVSDDERIWLVTRGPEETPCGLVFLTRYRDGQSMELSYLFHPSTWGQGIASRAVRAVLAGASDLDLVVETQCDNARSGALLTRLGWREVDRVVRFGAEQVIYRPG